jgi:hypothetical protein
MHFKCLHLLGYFDSPTERRKMGRRMTERRKTGRRMTEHRMTKRRIGPKAE